MNMETKIYKGGAGYCSPQVQILEVLSETVLCQSPETDQVTGQTGSDWCVGEDAEW